MNKYHEKSEYYCPYCLVSLVRVKTTGHLFCKENLINCDYEVVPGGRPPLSEQQCQAALKLRYNQKVIRLEKQINRYKKELSALNQQIASIERLETV